MSARDEARARFRATLANLVGEGPIERLDEALTHPSYSHEVRVPHNQRLEVLGDAVLGLCTSEMVTARYPEADEGALSRVRSAAINANALAAWARKVDLGPAIAVGRGARSDRDQTNVLADAVEAVVAAVYEALGLSAARALVRDVVHDALASAEESGGRDPKSTLQERVQARGDGTPAYRVVERVGPSHAPRFTVEVFVGDRVLGSGTGPTKKLAERVAAEAALAADDTAVTSPT